MKATSSSSSLLFATILLATLQHQTYLAVSANQPPDGLIPAASATGGGGGGKDLLHPPQPILEQVSVPGQHESALAAAAVVVEQLQQQLPLAQRSTISAAAPGEQLQLHHHHQDASQVAREATKLEQQQQQPKCTPMLNFQALLARPISTDPKVAAGEIGGAAANLMDKFSFPIGDIDMPVAPQEGSISSAIKLLSSFNSQFESPDLQADPSEMNMVKFRHNRLHIQGTNLTMLNVHLFPDSEPKFGVGILIKNTTLSGQFTYNGPLQLSGFYRMSIDNVYLVASSNLTKQFGIRTIGLDGSETIGPTILRTNDFRLNITNLGYISIDIFDSSDFRRPTTNYLLRMLQRLMQKTIKRTYYTFENYIRQTLEMESKRSLDCELTRFTHLLDNGGITSHQNDLARILNSEIVRSQLSSVQLPEFTYQQQLFGSSAIIQFYNGSLDGLNHIRLNGETRIKLQDEHLFVNTSVGWSDLKPYYNWNLLIGNLTKTPTTKGMVLFNLKEVDFDAVITKGLKPHAKISVDQLLIKRLDSPKMDISGLPGMNRVTRGMVNFFMGRLKQRLALSIQPALRQQLERSLNRMNIFN